MVLVRPSSLSEGTVGALNIQEVHSAGIRDRR